MLQLKNDVYTCITAPGPPPSLTVTAANVSSITIQWDPVRCQDRNRDIRSYRVTYHPSSYPNDGDVITVGEEDRVFTLRSLPPRTNYTFKVQAFDLRNLVVGVSANLTASTSKPLGK